MQIEKANNWFHGRIYNEFNNKFVRWNEVNGVESVFAVSNISNVCKYITTTKQLIEILKKEVLHHLQLHS